MKEIADQTDWSYHQVTYWMDKHSILRRNWSESAYLKHNPNGDPFNIKELKNKEDFRIFHIGIGLYLGEGDKKTNHAVKLANSDPKILKLFLRFLREICGVKESKIGFELNIFNDVNLKNALDFWMRSVGFQRPQLKTLIVRESRGEGSYKKKSKYGTLSAYVTNVKLKSLINKWCEEVEEYH